MKRTISIILCIIIALSVVVSHPANAAEVSSVDSDEGDSGDLIYFNAKGWKNYTSIYCHIWEIGDSSFFIFQTKYEECKKVKGTTYSYDLSKLKKTYNNITLGDKGLISGKKYCVLFSSNTGAQTYDATIGLKCIGDTLKLTGKKIENPDDDYNKKSDEAKWQNNGDKYGPHLTITYDGHIIGSKLAPGEKGYEVIGEWVPSYYDSEYCKPIDVLSKAYPKFGIKTTNDLSKAYNYCEAMTNMYNKVDLPKMKKIMKKAFEKAYPDFAKNNISKKWKVKGLKSKTYTGKAIKQKIKVVYGKERATVKISYKNNKNPGKATIIIKGKGKYHGTIKKHFTIKKAPNKMKVKAPAQKLSFEGLKYSSQLLDVIRISKAVGKVTVKKASKSKYISLGTMNLITVKRGTPAGKYIYKVKVKAKGNKYYKAKTKIVNVKIVVC